VCSLYLPPLFGLLAAPPTDKPPDSSTISPITEFFKAASAIMDSGPALWKKIAKYQADGAIQTVATGATNLEIAKTQLKHDILSGKITSKRELSGRVNTLLTQIEEFQTVLDRFATEIDSSSENTGNEIRAAADAELSGKADSVTKVTSLWSPDELSRKKSADQLEVGVACSRYIAVAAICLKNTIEKGKRDESESCSDKALQDALKKCGEQQKLARPSMPTGSGKALPKGPVGGKSKD
jgi:hypothetical protein